MNIREEVRRLVELGPLPDSDSTTEEELARLQAAIEAIPSPVTREEATLLLMMFGPDECYGLAWAGLSLIETTPGGPPIESQPPPDANEWVRLIWDSMQRARR